MNRNEADTRADLIDPHLINAGWGKVDLSLIRREEICPGRIMAGGRRSAKVSSDYVLIYKGRKLAVVEAKREGLSYTEGVRQAKDYATRLQCRIAYVTNGHEIYQIDMFTGEEKLVEQFLSPDECWAVTFAEEVPDYAHVWRERFAQIPFKTKGDWSPRYYQENAIQNALEAIAHGENRVLLTLATGTGKTCIGFQLSWKLFQSHWSLNAQKKPDEAKRRPRILFLADRNILADQAFNDFGAFGEDAITRIEPSEIKKKGSVPKNASVFFTIFQTFMSGPNTPLEELDEAEDDEIVADKNPYYKDYPEDFFDFIVIDECHRGGANSESSWRDILDYFAPAVQLGLTATPKRTDNADTYDYFGEPVYSYTLKEGINDGFLTPFKVLPIVGTMDEYVYTPGDGVVITGEPEAGLVYKESDFNRIITIPAREEKRVHYWMDRFKPSEKTIVFCATQTHAGMVRDFINQYAVKKGWTTNTSYCVRVTANDGKAGENDLKIFQDNEKTIPTILTTSRKLSTGVDARNVRNIVLMRPCNNMIEFKQIVGRGTRVYDGKDFFTIYDFVKAHQNFADPDWDGEPLAPEASSSDDTQPEKVKDKPEPKPEPLDDSSGSEKVVITLSDGKTRQIRHVSATMYWSAEGKPVTAKEFMDSLYDDFPRFFKDEEQLREIWSDPDTRESLLNSLAEEGYDRERLEAMKRVIDAEDSDVYDVLSYVAFESDAIARRHRVKNAAPILSQTYSYKQKEFIDFVLSKYIEDGVRELSPTKMSGLLELKYQTISDAAAHFGSIQDIRETFLGFQKHLYEEKGV